MTQYVCDRCRKVEVYKQNLTGITVGVGTTATHDLCDKCLRDLREFLRPLPAVSAMVKESV